MTINRAFFTLSVFTFIVFCSCKKESPTIPDDLTVDSLTVIKSIRSVNYDDQNQPDFVKNEFYMYDSSGRKITVNIVDSFLTYPNVVSFSETFTSDMSGRLTLFESTTTDGISCDKIEFIYGATGSEVQKAILHYNNGNILESIFSYSTNNGNKVLTMYDTSGTNGINKDMRPRIVQYSFDADNHLVHQIEAATSPSSKDRNSWFRDTTEIMISYKGHNIDNYLFKYNYFNGQENTPFYSYSNAFTNESAAADLWASYLNIYRNLYWFSAAETINNSFAETMVNNANYPHYFYYGKNPVQKMSVTDHQVSTSTPSQVGIFQNTFDQKGSLVRTIYPKGFANKYGGETSVDYSYTKIKMKL